MGGGGGGWGLRVNTVSKPLTWICLFSVISSRKSPGIGQNAKRTLSSKPGTLCLVIFLSEDVSTTPGRY